MSTQTLNDAERSAKQQTVNTFKSSEDAKKRMVRTGKTLKDHRNGAKHKNEQNKQSRAAWQADSKKLTFPASSCNGKRNRYQVTGKGGVTIILSDKRK